MIVLKIAAIPEERASAIAPPGIIEKRFSSTPFVGFIKQANKRVNQSSATQVERHKQVTD
jgi:hypothetical protein